MMPWSEAVKRWLIWFGVVSVILAARVACVIYERSRPYTFKQPLQRPIEQDYLSVVPKFHVNDPESAGRLIGKTLWIKAGYQAEYFPLPRQKKVPTRIPKQRFEPLEKITVQKIMERSLAPGNNDREVLLIFQREANQLATVVGFYNSKEKQYYMPLDELFYLKDPHEIYDHWSQEIWRKIESHQLEKQMTFAQVALSIGSGSLITTEAGGIQLYEFNRRPGGEVGRTRVRFGNGRVKEFEVLQ